MRRLTIVKLVGLGIVVGILILLSVVVDTSILLDEGRMRSAIEENPLKGMMWFLILSLMVKLLFVPASPLSLLGGYLFGGTIGTILSVTSITIASLIIFFIGRFLGRGFVRDLLEEKYSQLQKYDDMLARNGMVATVFFRIVPTLPLSAVNLGLAITRIKLSDFIFGTIVGVLPGSFLLANAGERITDITDPLLYVFLALFVLMVSCAGYIGYRRRRG